MARNKLMERVRRHAKDEAKETPAQERKESPAFQRMEKKMGVEKHPPSFGKKK